MQIQPQFMTVSTLLNGRIFKIPEYQRAYSWGSKQRTDLFNDIRRLKDADDKGHFLATMVGLCRRKVRIAADAYTEVEVVDGQQRLTTITILLRALQKHLTEGDAKQIKLAEELQRLLVKGDDLNLLLLQTNHDSSHIFVEYVREGRIADPFAAKTSADQNIVDAITECEGFVSEWATNGDVVALLAILRNQLSVIFYEIADEALVYSVFEVLNSRGLDVTWFDKVKAMLMAIVFEHGDSGGKTATIAELHRIWRDIYRTIGTRQSLNRETLRFAASLKARTKPSRPLSEEVSATEVMAQCGTSPKKAVDLSKWLLRVCEAEERLLANNRLRSVTQIVQARLLAIAIMLRKFPSAEEKTLLETWEKITFRIYGLADFDARNAVGDYVRLAWSVMNEKLTAVEAKKAIEELGKNIVSLQEAVEGIRRTDVYSSRAETVRYFLFRYEEHLAARAGQRLNEAQWNKIWLEDPSKSIEHIKPQSSGVKYMHRLGNLTMLPPGVNSRFKDREPLAKASEYETCGLLDCIDVSKRIRKEQAWNVTTVEARENDLLIWALSAWKV